MRCRQLLLSFLGLVWCWGAAALPDHFAVLGVSRNSSAEAIARAFTQKLDAATTAEDRAAIREAYRVLSDPQSRSMYEQELYRESRAELRAQTRQQLLADMRRSAEIDASSRNQVASIMQLISLETAAETQRLRLVSLQKQTDELLGLEDGAVSERMSERHRVFRGELVRLREDLLLGAPNTKQVITYLDAISGKLFRTGAWEAIGRMDDPQEREAFDQIAAYGFQRALSSTATPAEFEALFLATLNATEFEARAGATYGFAPRGQLLPGFTVADAGRQYASRFPEGNLARVAERYLEQSVLPSMPDLLRVAPILGPERTLLHLQAQFEYQFFEMHGGTRGEGYSPEVERVRDLEQKQALQRYQESLRTGQVFRDWPGNPSFARADAQFFLTHWGKHYAEAMKELAAVFPDSPLFSPGKPTWKQRLADRIAAVFPVGKFNCKRAWEFLHRQ